MNETIETAVEGNTKTSTKDTQAIRWCFTLNLGLKDEMDISGVIALSEKQIINDLHKFCKYYIVGIECQTRWHLQGYIELNSKKRFTYVKSILGDKVHIEKSKGNKEVNQSYCAKEKLHKWEFTKVKPKYDYDPEMLGILKEEELFDWQKKIIDIITKKPTKRVIYWYWSKSGGIGKTEFTKYLVYHYNAKFVQGSKKDIMCSLIKKDKKGTSTRELLGDTPLIIFGFARSAEDYVSYDALESLKDGLLFNSKYESNFEMIPIPHVLVFCNFAPDHTKLSSGRIKEKRLDNDSDSDSDESLSSEKLGTQRVRKLTRSSSVSSQNPHLAPPQGGAPLAEGQVAISSTNRYIFFD